MLHHNLHGPLESNDFSRIILDVDYHFFKHQSNLIAALLTTTFDLFSIYRTKKLLISNFLPDFINMLLLTVQILSVFRSTKVIVHQKQDIRDNVVNGHQCINQPLS